MSVLTRVSRWFTMGDRWKRARFAFKVALQDPTLYPLHVSPAFDVALCQEMFVRNQTLVHTYAASHGSQALTYLQPYNACGRRVTSHSDAANVAHLRRRVCADGTTELEAIDRFYASVAAEFARHGDDFIDLTSIFDRIRSDVYIDQVHCSDIGYDLMATRIADDILAREGVA